jgi:hypothetical protein
MITLGGDAELELVDTLDPFSEVRTCHWLGQPSLACSCGPGTGEGRAVLGVLVAPARLCGSWQRV